jgi:hypothetical protein
MWGGGVSGIVIVSVCLSVSGWVDGWVRVCLKRIPEKLPEKLAARICVLVIGQCCRAGRFATLTKARSSDYTCWLNIGYIHIAVLWPSVFTLLMRLA